MPYKIPLMLFLTMSLLSGCVEAPTPAAADDTGTAQTAAEVALCAAMKPLPTFDPEADSTQTQIEIATFGRRHRCLCGEAAPGDNCPDLE